MWGEAPFFSRHDAATGLIMFSVVGLGGTPPRNTLTKPLFLVMTEGAVLGDRRSPESQAASSTPARPHAPTASRGHAFTPPRSSADEAEGGLFKLNSGKLTSVVDFN